MKKLFVILLLLSSASFARHAYASIAFGASTRGSPFSGGTSLSFTSPAVSGLNTVATVSIGMINGTLTGVTWGGVSMTQVPSSTVKNGIYTETNYYLANPSAGASTVVVSASSGWTDIFADARYFTGVDQSSPIDAGATCTAGSGTSVFLCPVTTISSGDYILDTVNNDNGCDSPTADSPSVTTESGCDGLFSWGTSYQGPIGSPSSVATRWVSASGDAWTGATLALQPVRTLTASLHLLTLFSRLIIIGGRLIIK